MIVSKDHELVAALKLAAEDVAGTFDEIKWAMDNVSHTMETLMKDMNKRIWFHDFWGLRVVSRAIAYGFVQVSALRYVLNIIEMLKIGTGPSSRKW